MNRCKFCDYLDEKTGGCTDDDYVNRFTGISVCRFDNNAVRKGVDHGELYNMPIKK